MLPTIAILEPPKIEPITLIIKQEQAPPPEPTVEEKIATNFYNCNTDIEWIRADTAECKPKSPSRSQNPARGAVSSSRSRFTYGWCTYLADQLRPDIGASGNANTWIRFANSKTPQVGAIAVNTWGLGHVAYVVDYNTTQVLVKHMNWHGFGVTSTDWIDRSYWQGYIL